MTSDIQKQKLRGKVKSIKCGNHLKKFNESGNLLKEIYGIPSSTDKYKYNNKGNLIKKTCDLLKIIESYKYDYAGRVIEAKKKSYDGETLKVTKYQYNKDLNINSIHIHNIYENRLNQEFSKYDDRGNEIEYKRYNDNILEFKEIYMHDINNHRTKTITWQNDENHKSLFGIPNFSEISKHDDKGNVTENITIRAIWTIVDYLIPLNISQLFISFFTKREYKYDDEGNLTKEVWLNQYKYRSIDTFVHTYTYDSVGNWIQKISIGESNTMNRNGREMQERIIEYY